MKQTVLTRNFLKNRIAIKFLTFSLVLAFLLLTGCNNGKTTDNNSNASSSSDASSPSSSSDAASDSSPEQNNSEVTGTVKVVDAADGVITFESQNLKVDLRDDADEIIPTGNCANLSTNMKGLFEAEADARRNQILNAGNTEDIYTDKITGTTYYISPGGNDENNGTSPDAPLRTVDALNSIKLKAGDAVLFERNSVFRFISSFNTIDGVVYGAYGEGSKPKIYASPMNYAKCEWEPSERKNIWKTDYVYDELCSMIFEHGEKIGYRKTSVRNLKKNTDFYVDESASTLYLYCDQGNPASQYKSIEVCTKFSIFTIPSFSGDVVIDNLCLKYSGVMAIEAKYNCHNVTITNCEIGYIGGASGSSRYGNAIQAWCGIQGFNVSNNWIYQIWDSAISWQGNAAGTADQYVAEYSNITINNNLLEFNNSDIEIWDENELLSGTQQMNGNICRFTSLGWGTRADDGGYRGIEGVFGNCNTSNMNIAKGTVIEVIGTIIDCPGREIFNWAIYGTGRNENEGASMWNHYKISGTKVAINLSYRTSDCFVRGCRRNADDVFLIRSNTNDEIITALKRFDNNVSTTIVGE